MCNRVNHFQRVELKEKGGSSCEAILPYVAVTVSSNPAVTGKDTVGPHLNRPLGQEE